jgi:AcrR family transcriptional regulator
VSSPATLPLARKRGESRALTRRRLMHFGRRAFARKGHAGTNLRDDILVPARVSVGSFYHQFSDKTDLFLEILREHSETFRRMIREAHTPTPEGDPRRLARHSFETVFRIAEENDDLFRIMVREQASEDPRVRAYLRENHDRWIESLVADYRAIALAAGGQLAAASDERFRLAAELISAMTLGTVASLLDRPPRERVQIRRARIEALVDFTVAGAAGLLGALPGSPAPLRTRPHTGPLPTGGRRAPGRNRVHKSPARDPKGVV